jgi:hypothetical protein
MVFADAAPPASVGATLLLRGTGVNSSAFGAPQEAAFLMALSSFFDVTIGQLDVAAPVGVSGGVSLSFTVDAASRIQAASLAAALTAAVPSNRSSVSPSLWQAMNSSGLTLVSTIRAYGMPYVQAAPTTNGSVPVAVTTLLLGGVPLASIGNAEEVALCEALAAAVNCAPDQVVISGMADSTAGAQVGVVIRTISTAAAAALATSLDYSVPALVSAQNPVLAGVLASATSTNLTALTAVSAANDTVLVGGAVPSASVDATLVLDGAGLGAASFGATQQAAFAAALSSFLNVSGSAVALTGAADEGASNVVAVSFSVAALGGAQAAAMVAALGGATGATSSAAPALLQAVTGGGLPQVISVASLGAGATVVQPASAAPASFSLKPFSSASAFAMPQQAALLAGVSQLLNATPGSLLLTGVMPGASANWLVVTVSATKVAWAPIAALSPLALLAALQASGLPQLTAARVNVTLLAPPPPGPPPPRAPSPPPFPPFADESELTR